MAAGRLIVNEVPAGVVNGANTTFTIANTPSGGAIELYQDGVRLTPGVHYTLSGQTITYLAGYTPQTGSRHLTDYVLGSPVLSNAEDLTTLSNVKTWLNITNNNSDALLTRLITAESSFMQQAMNRFIARTTYLEVFNGDDERVKTKSYLNPWLSGPLFGGFLIGARGFAITLKNIPLLPFLVDGVTDSIVVTIDGGDGSGQTPLTPVPKATNLGQTSQTEGWVAHEDTGKIELLGYRFTLGINNCTIQYDAGYDSIPTDIEQATIELIAWRFRERDRIGQSSRTVNGETVAFSGAAVPSRVQQVIDNYRVVKDG